MAGGHAWQWGVAGGMHGKNMHGGGHAWQGGTMHGGGHVWQGASMVGGMHGREEACVAGGMHGRGCAWWGCGCMCGKGACVAGYAHPPRYHEIWSISG